MEEPTAGAEIAPGCEPGPSKDLSGCDYSGEDLTGANFNGSSVAGANFSGATLTAATFNGADLRCANFTNAVLNFVSFEGATMTGATFEGADLTGATFSASTTCPDGVSAGHDESCLDQLTGVCGIAPTPTADVETPPAETPAAESTVTVAFDAEGIPAGSQICLVNVDTGEEQCQPVPETGAQDQTGIRSFLQAAPTLLTFPNLPPGTYQVILRAPGYEDLVLRDNVTVAPGQETAVTGIPDDIEDQLEPSAPPVNPVWSTLLRLLIAILIQILTSLGVE
jgi:hypothetical protein